MAFSRVKTYNGLHLINYDRHQIRANGRVRAEMDRLRNEKKLPTIPIAMIWNLPTECVSMVHLNTQGLRYRGRTKQLDIQQDKEIQAVDILCITETHFEVNDPVDTKFFWKEKNGQLYRRERQGRKGGGVIVLVSDKYTSDCLHIVSPLEVVGVEVYCPNKVVMLCFYVPPGLNKVSGLQGDRKNYTRCMPWD